MEIIEYEDKYKEDFRRLSYEWLEKYVFVEPEDEIIINNPREIVLNPGGHIYFIKHLDEIIGTVSLIKTEGNSFELAKLAVTEKYKGFGFGNILITTCINISEIENMDKIILYTSHKLLPAINLYKKFGFKEVPLIGNKYIESDIKMELSI